MCSTETITVVVEFPAEAAALAMLPVQLSSGNFLTTTNNKAVERLEKKLLTLSSPNRPRPSWEEFTQQSLDERWRQYQQRDADTRRRMEESLEELIHSRG